MTVTFIGAGPGAADLITVRGQRVLTRAQVCLYAGSLVPAELLDSCPPGAELVDTADLTLDEIVARMVEADRAGLDVARLCSGDPSIYSAVAEQMRRLDEAGVAYDVVPGVPAFAAAAATLRRELTVPTVGQTVVLTRAQSRSTAMPAGEDLAVLGATRATLVLHLAVGRTRALAERLVPHYGADCPVAVVARASRPDELVLRGTLADIADQVEQAGVRRTAVIIVGEVLAAEGFPDSYLYSAGRDRSAKRPVG
ncbi:precorrin-4 C(11)-methyltransferase [Plantactinospora soyae]|uniref:Precorrin-4/cobalt-precorrin-4 C11-methyltransferase n=1 Tax=Plantactinospora soyae TaxID=1544732 RepID=A0A927MC83_9ACTN|nr:precorrin-4 C(11)-methyltransferase [Plantactinospora soyae]MBE1491809.1 precorrin-4/cobalt-precorrin-4 C11-methyltransferase [Plantactinospora soyae]